GAAWRAAGRRDGRELVVLDTTDPETIAATDFSDAFMLVSSKSGNTLEVQALFAHAWSLVPEGGRYAAITDPATPLANPAALAGRDKVTIVVPEDYRSFGLWVEQLIAESTGKRGKGCVPVPTTETEQGTDRHVVLLELGEPEELAAEFLRWEIATAIAGHVLELDPFDEPNVAESKENTARALASPPPTAVDTPDPPQVATCR